MNLDIFVSRSCRKNGDDMKQLISRFIVCVDLYDGNAHSTMALL